jgi:hypothetical protein
MPGLIGQQTQQNMLNGQQYALGKQQLALGQQTQQANALKLQAAQAQQAQDEQYQQDVAAWTQAGSPATGLTGLIAKYPDQYKALQAGWQVKDDAQRTADLGYFGGVHAALQKGNTQLAAKLIQDRITAEQKAGLDTTQDQQLLEGIQKGDQQSIDSARGYSLAQIAAATGPAKFADTFDAAGEGDKSFTLTPGAKRFDAQGNVIAAAPAAVHYEKIQTVDADGNPVTQVVAVGGEGGGQASGVGGASGGSGGPARVYGWTPRGDNSNAAVDNKIAGMSRALGVGADAPFAPGTSNMDIARALAISEGGAGSLADRNNNPGNLRDPKTGAYRKFPTKEAGLAAAAAQVARNRARGQNSIRTMVEGIPTGGKPQTAGGAQVLYSARDGSGGGENAQLDDATVNMMAQQYLAGDPSVMTNLGRSKQGLANIVRLRTAIAQQARAQGMNGGQIANVMQDFETHQQALNAFAKGPEALTVRSLNVALDHLDTLQNAAQALQNGNIPIFNKVRQGWAKATGSPIPTNFEGVRQIVSTEVAKAVTGGKTALADRQDLIHSVATANSPQQLAGYIAQIKELLTGQLHGLSLQYKSGTGRDDFNSRLSPRTQRLLGFKQGQQQPNPGGFRILQVRPK